MSTLSDLQASAIRLGEELYQAKYNGTEPPTHEELTEFMVEVEQGEPDTCTRCAEVDSAVQDFSGLICKPEPVLAECMEALAVILNATGCYRRVGEARSELNALMVLMRRQIASES